MDFSENDSSGFDREAADQLYQLLLDLNTYGTTEICIDPRSLLSSDFDEMTAINRSAALEKEAQDILKVFTSAPITPVHRDTKPAENKPNERALVLRSNINIVKRRDCYKIDIWKDNSLVISIENNSMKNVPMHFISIKIETTGTFIITGLDNVDHEIKQVIREIGGLIAIEDDVNATSNEDGGVEIREITDGSEPVIEVPLHDGILKFTANQNPLDVLSEIYCTEETSDNKKIFKVPILGDFIVSPEDDPVQVFKAITGHDLTEFYRQYAPGNTNVIITEILDDTENKENETKVKTTRSQRNKKNKQKRKSKKRK